MTTSTFGVNAVVAVAITHPPAPTGRPSTQQIWVVTCDLSTNGWWCHVTNLFYGGTTYVWRIFPQTKSEWWEWVSALNLEHKDRSVDKKTTQAHKIQTILSLFSRITFLGSWLYKFPAYLLGKYLVCWLVCNNNNNMVWVVLRIASINI
jgi:hypothetical protein